MAEFPKVQFFFPYRHVGGVPVLFLRLSEELASRYGCETGIIDFPDGYMARNLPVNSPVKVTSFCYRRRTEIDSSTILVLQSMPPYKFPMSLRPAPGTRIVFWTLFQYNFGEPPIRRRSLSPRLGIMKAVRGVLAWRMDRRRRPDVRRAVVRMAECGSLWFGDMPNVRSTSELLNFPIQNPIVIPVPSEDVEVNLKIGRERSSDQLAIGWLGRLCDFKIHILAYTILRVSRWAAEERRKVVFRVIGDGPEARVLDTVSSEHAFFKIERMGDLERQAVTDYLLQHVDIMAAMGTSALDALRLGIPTLRLDASYEPVEGDYSYEWFWEKDEVNLGEFLTAVHFEPGNKSLESRLASVQAEYEQLSRASMEHYKRIYSKKAVCEQFLKYAQEARFTFGEFQKDELRKGALRRCYENLTYR